MADNNEDRKQLWKPVVEQIFKGVDVRIREATEPLEKRIKELEQTIEELKKRVRQQP